MRTSLFIFFMVIFIGCSENDIIDEGEKPEDPQAEIEVYYDQESTSSENLMQAQKCICIMTLI